MAKKKLTQDEILKASQRIRGGASYVPPSGSGGYIAPTTRTYVPPIVNSSSLLGKGEGHRIPGIGAVATALNVADQLHSALTVGLKESFDTKNFLDPTAGFKGFWRGLKGDEHASYADVLEAGGIHNPIVKAAIGTPMDFVLDPAMWFGVGELGGISRGAAELRAGKKVAEEALLKGLTEGTEGTAEETASIIGRHLTKENIAATAKNIRRAEPTKWEFRYGLPFTEHTAAPWSSIDKPEWAYKVGDVIKGPEGNQRLLFRALSRKAEQPFGMAELGRISEGALQSDFADQYQVLKRLYAKITPDDRYHAFLRYENTPGIENRALQELPPSRAEALGARTTGRAPLSLKDEGYSTIDDIVHLTRTINRKITRAELEMGMHKTALPSEWAKVAGEDPSTFGMNRQIFDFEDLPDSMREQVIAKAMGKDRLRRIVRNPRHLETRPGLAKSANLKERYVDISDLDVRHIPQEAKPVIDIGESMLQRLRDTYALQIQADFHKQAIEKFGINSLDPAEGSAVMHALQNADKDGNLRFKPIQPGEGKNLLHSPVASLRKYSNYYLPNDIADILNAAHKTVTDDTVGRQILAGYDRALSHWKAANSLMNPGYLTRTSIGDFVQNAVAGVWNPARYSQARNVLKEASRNRLDDVLSGLVNPDLPLNAIRDSRPTAFHVSVGGADMGADRIYDLFHSSGAKSGELVTETLPGTVVGLGEKAPAAPIKGVRQIANKGGNVLERMGAGINAYEAKMADANIFRETHLRMANFINKMDAEATKELVKEARLRKMSTKDLSGIRATLGPERVARIEHDAAMKAGAHVRKYNIDYGMLSTTEKNVMRRIVPFYSWFRRNAPQQFEQMLSHPGMMTALPKTINGLEELLGTESPEGDFMLPQWIRESMPFRVAMGGEEAHNPVSWLARKLTGATGENAVFIPTLSGISPMQDIETVAGPITRAIDVAQMRGGVQHPSNWAPAFWEGTLSGMQNALNMTAPPIKALGEAGTRHSAYTGQKITNWNDWALSQLGSPGRQLSRGVGISDQPTVAGLSAALTGLQVQPITQARQKGEFQRRKDVLDPEIQRMKSALAKKKGVSKDSKRYEKLSDQEIRQYKNYLRRAGRAVGSY